jgi:hypothetical protein
MEIDREDAELAARLLEKAETVEARRCGEGVLQLYCHKLLQAHYIAERAQQIANEGGNAG